MKEDQPKLARRLVWIIITAVVGAIITAIVTGVFKEAQKEEPKLKAGALFNGLTARTKTGVLRTVISLTNEGDQTLYNVQVSGKLTPSEGFDIVDPRLREFGGSVRCSTELDSTEVSPHFSALCEYLNPGDFWQIEIWHLGISHGATIQARGKGLSHLEHLNPDFEEIKRICAMLSIEIQSDKLRDLLPQYCRDRFGY